MKAAIINEELPRKNSTFSLSTWGIIEHARTNRSYKKIRQKFDNESGEEGIPAARNIHEFHGEENTRQHEKARDSAGQN